MPFEMKNSPAMFQCLINMIINGLENCDMHIDDVIIYNDTWEEHLTTIWRFLDQLNDAQLTINLNKTEFCKSHVQYIGHNVGEKSSKTN